MKAHEFISRLDEARYGRLAEEGSEDKGQSVKKAYKQPSGSSPAPIAEKPSHAPTSTAQWKTTGKGKSEDEGEAVEKGYKQPSASIPSPVAAKPSHAPTSGKDATTSGQGKSEDEGETVKKAMKEAINSLIDGDDTDASVAALLGEGGHKAGCKCGFCERMRQNKSGNKPKGEEDSESGGLDSGESTESGTDMKESVYDAPPPQHRLPGRPMPSGRPPMQGSLPAKRRIGGERGIPFRHPFPKPGQRVAPPKAAINPNQPAMERRSQGRDPELVVQEQADKLLENPDFA